MGYLKRRHVRDYRGERFVVVVMLFALAGVAFYCLFVRYAW